MCCMSDIDWTEIALRCGPLIGSQRRGVLNISNLGFFVIFVPASDRSRVERELAAEYLTIHGTAIHQIEEEAPIFVAVVKADNVDNLRAIANVVGSKAERK
jgi:hypothetical protein